MRPRSRRFLGAHGHTIAYRLRPQTGLHFLPVGTEWEYWDALHGHEKHGKPGKNHFARAASEPAWIEVKSTPPWTADDHFVL